MAISRDRINEAVEEAQRFIKRAEDCLEELSGEGRSYYITGTKASGALRRASLDLTRALARLRDVDLR